jgi:hypothetical protein
MGFTLLQGAQSSLELLQCYFAVHKIPGRLAFMPFVQVLPSPVCNRERTADLTSEIRIEFVKESGPLVVHYFVFRVVRCFRSQTPRALVANQFQ